MWPQHKVLLLNVITAAAQGCCGVRCLHCAQPPPPISSMLVLLGSEAAAVDLCVMCCYGVVVLQLQ